MTDPYIFFPFACNLCEIDCCKIAKSRMKSTSLNHDVTSSCIISRKNTTMIPDQMLQLPI